MKIRILTGMAGPDFVVAADDEVDWPKGRAEHFIAAGLAEALEEPAKPKPRKKRRSKRA